MGVFHIFLVVGVNPFLFVISCLDSLLHQVVLSHTSEILLHFAIVEDLVSSYLFQLHRVQLVLLLLLLLHHFGLANLHFALQVNLVDLVLVQALEVVGFHAMGCQHADLGLRVLGHEIMVIGILELMLLELRPSLVHLQFPFLLLLSHDFVDVVRVDFVLCPRFIVVFLGLLQDLIEFQCLLIEQVVDSLLQLLLL